MKEESLIKSNRVLKLEVHALRMVIGDLIKILNDETKSEKKSREIGETITLIEKEERLKLLRAAKETEASITKENYKGWV